MGYRLQYERSNGEGELVDYRTRTNRARKEEQN
jgi:hypothetical protein